MELVAFSIENLTVFFRRIYPHTRSIARFIASSPAITLFVAHAYAAAASLASRQLVMVRGCVFLPLACSNLSAGRACFLCSPTIAAGGLLLGNDVQDTCQLVLRALLSQRRT